MLWMHASYECHLGKCKVRLEMCTPIEVKQTWIFIMKMI